MWPGRTGWGRTGKRRDEKTGQTTRNRRFQVFYAPRFPPCLWSSFFPFPFVRRNVFGNRLAEPGILPVPESLLFRQRTVGEGFAGSVFPLRRSGIRENASGCSAPVAVLRCECRAGGSGQGAGRCRRRRRWGLNGKRQNLKLRAPIFLRCLTN